MQIINIILKFILPFRVYNFLKLSFFKIISEVDFIISDINIFLNDEKKKFKPHVIPNTKRRYQVHGKKDVESFVLNGESNAITIKNYLKKNSYNINDFDKILDWGCGPGKVLQSIYINSNNPKQQLFGTDISNLTISWAQKNLRFANFNNNGIDPVLPYEDNFFGFIYGISVFTHLDAEHEVWLKELSRVLENEGVLLLTFHGEHCASIKFKNNIVEHKKFHNDGIYFSEPPKINNRHNLPEFYGSTYHTRKYIEQKFQKYFDIIDYSEREIRNFQDAALFIKKSK